MLNTVIIFRCDHEIHPHMLQAKFNKTCLNCYWQKRGDENRKCLSTFDEVLQDSNKCAVKPIDPNHHDKAPVTIKVKTDV